MTAYWQEIILGVLLAIIIGYWWRVLPKDASEEEEEDMTIDECDANEVLQAKIACLEAANTQGKTADEVVKDAQKFWDFIAKMDDDS